MITVVKFLTLKQLADKCGLSPSAIKWQISRGRVNAVKKGRDWLIPDNEIEPGRYLTVNILAQKMGFSRSHVRLLLRQGEIEGDRLGRDWIITNLEQRDYVRRRRNPARRKRHHRP